MLMLHVLVCLAIVLSLPSSICLVLPLFNVPTWVTIANACVAIFWSVWFMLIYIDKIVTKRILKWLNED